MGLMQLHGRNGSPMKRHVEISRRSFLATAAAFILPPPRLARAAASDLTFLVLGDWGMGTSEQRRVAAQMGKAAAAIGTRFVISTGDNFYPDGVTSAEDTLWKTHFEDVYAAPALMIPWYIALGNHDHRGNVDAQVEYTKRSSRWRMPATYYKHTETLADRSHADFFFIDSQVIRDGHRRFWVRSAGDAQLMWLERELAASTARWKIAVGHHPVFSGGKHGNTEPLVVLLKPLLERYGVQVYLSGHDHDLQHLAVGKVHYLISGAGSAPRPSRAVAGTRFVMGNRLGFMAARLAPHAMDIEFIDDGGTSLYRASIPMAP
jgi:tartrate-resistant acid phosphatase type 5